MGAKYFEKYLDTLWVWVQIPQVGDEYLNKYEYIGLVLKYQLKYVYD